MFLVGRAEGKATLVPRKPGTSKDDRSLEVMGGGPLSLREGIRSEDRVVTPVERDAGGL